MILHGNVRGGARDLALHLMKEENDHVELHELRGFACGDLMGALNEAHAVSRGTRCKQFLFSVSLSPPPEEKVGVAVFETAVGRIEDRLGLTGQPRAVVFHEKDGRRHCHAVWSRIDVAEMKAVPLPFTKRALREISRDVFMEQGWTLPRGLMNSQERDPRNFTHAQWQQAKRLGKDPRAIETALRDCWAVSDSRAAFTQALQERGYALARGDRRGVVAVDHRGEVFAVSKWVGIKAKDVRAKLSDTDGLPSVDAARRKFAQDMAAHLRDLDAAQQKTDAARRTTLDSRRAEMVQRHRRDRAKLGEIQDKRREEETRARQARFSKGLRGLFDVVTGTRKRIKARNEIEALESFRRDRREKDDLVFRQVSERRSLHRRMERLKKLQARRQTALRRDIAQYDEIRQEERETFAHKEPALDMGP